LSPFCAENPFGGGAARNAYFALTYFHVGLEAAAVARGLEHPVQQGDRERAER
jgi:hypothetical protein